MSCLFFLRKTSVIRYINWCFEATCLDLFFFFFIGNSASNTEPKKQFNGPPSRVQHQTDVNLAIARWMHIHTGRTNDMPSPNLDLKR